MILAGLWPKTSYANIPKANCGGFVKTGDCWLAMVVMSFVRRRVKALYQRLELLLCNHYRDHAVTIFYNL